MTSIDEKKREAILARRAERLAQDHALDRDRQEGIQVVVFADGDHEFAIPAAHLREVITLPPISELPGLPPWIRGITQVRGELFAVVDFHRWLQREGEGIATYLAVVEVGDRAVGLTIEQVIGGRDLDPEKLAPAGAGAPSHSVPLRGVTPELIALLDTEAITLHQDLLV